MIYFSSILYCAFSILFSFILKVCSSKKIFYICCLFISFLASIFAAYFSKDSEAYQFIFSNFNSQGFGNIFDEIKGYEIFYIMLPKVLPVSFSFAFFFIIAIFSVTLKMYLIEKSSRDKFISYISYFLMFLVLFDGTTIRAGLAISIAFISAYCFLINGKRNIFVLIVLLDGAFFHFSSFIFLILIFFRTKRSGYFLIFLWFFLVFLYFLGFNLSSILLGMFSYFDRTLPVFNKLYSYLNVLPGAGYPFSKIFLILFLFSSACFVLYSDRMNKFEILSFNSALLSFVFLALLPYAPGIQVRMSELFRFPIVFVFPFFVDLVSPISDKRLVSYAVLGVFFVSYFLYYFVYKGLFIF